MFNLTRFDLARNARGLTKRQLANLLDISERHLKNYENGTTIPDSEMMVKIASILKFPESFFYGEDLEGIEPENVSFRSFARLTSAKRRMALAHARLIETFADWIEANFDLPAPNIPDAQEIMAEGIVSPEICAEWVRSQWGLGQQPISHLVGLLESKGILVFTFALDISEVDACCLWYKNRPIIFLNTNKTAERCRFDAAHELGHLVMHRHGNRYDSNNDIEKEANSFASAFLIPRDSVLGMAPKLPTLEKINRLKKYWNVSAAALTYRLNELGLMTEWTYREVNRQLSLLGRSTEPEPSKHEQSILIANLFEFLREEGTTRVEVAKNLNIFPEVLDDWTFNLASTHLDNERLARIRRTALRVLD